MSLSPLHLAVALDDTGSHPVDDLVALAERGLLDFVTLGDCQPGQVVPLAAGDGPVVASARDRETYRHAARSADVVLVTPHDLDEAHDAVSWVRRVEDEVGRDGDRLRILVDLVVFVDEDRTAAAQRWAHLAGVEHDSDAAVFVGAVEELADLLTSWRQLGIDGFRLPPGELPHDLAVVVDHLVPALQERDVYRRAP